MTIKYDFVAKQQRLKEIAACPSCGSDLSCLDESKCGEFTVAASLVCDHCTTVGHICNGRFIFNGENFVVDGSPFVSAGFLDIQQKNPSFLKQLAKGAWNLADEFIWTDEAGATLTVDTSAMGLNIDFLVHSWAGVIEISIADRTVKEIDLFEPNGSSRLSVPLFLGRGEHRVEVTATGRRNAGSSAGQCHILGVQEVLESDTPVELGDILTGNRGNPYPAVWADILANAPADARILDCGSGDRCYPDDRVINFEYCAFGLPDIYGDGHSIPMKDNSFDIILSQAVFEHLYDPKKAASEIERILKPGGLVYVESAFMQPLHAVPFHFFNTTPWGLEKLFENLDRDEVQSHGTLTQTLQWIYSLCDIEGRGGRPKLDELLKLATELDSLITPDEMKKFSSFVSLTARKRS